MKLYLSEIYRLFKTEFTGKDMLVPGICTDTRKLKKGEVFFALIGETDGHMYSAKAFYEGAPALVVEKYAEGIETSRQIIVKNTTDAMLTLARFYYKKFKKIKCAAVTGSNGKTTTKEMIAAILGEKFRTLKSEKSFNNAIGLPQTVYELDNRYKAAVFEIGMNHAGEIRNLVSAISPDAAVITNVGMAHIGFFKDGLSGIARAKAEIMTGMKPKGTVIINADDKYAGFFMREAKKRKLEIVTFSLVNPADVKAYDVVAIDGGMEFSVSNLKERLFISLAGTHNVYNAAAAIALSSVFKIPENAIKKGLHKFRMEGFMRFEKIMVKNGVLLINDCYNANPDSFSASIEALKKEGTGPIVAVMGDMLELGKKSAKLHEQIGKKFREIPLKKFFVYGKFTRFVKRGYGPSAKTYTDKEKLSLDLKNAVQKGDTLFVKGSRENRLEEVIKALY